MSRTAGVKALVLPLALLMHIAFSAPASAQTASRPNILVIFGDDIGYTNVSSFGGDIMGVQTPNIDRIAKDGLRLTTYYAQPSCTAGRAASSPASCRYARA